MSRRSHPLPSQRRSSSASEGIRRSLLTNLSGTLAVALVALACRTTTAPETPVRIALENSLSLPCDFVWEQDVTASYGVLSRGFPAVVECSDHTLSLVGLTPFYTRAFLVQQTGTQVRFEKFLNEELPFSGEEILTDLHLTFFIGHGEPAPENGERITPHPGAKRRDRFENRLLKERSFENNAGKVFVRIRYEGGFNGKEPPPSITLENLDAGYTLKVDTRRAATLPASL